jgi:hypothetical protein
MLPHHKLAMELEMESELEMGRAKEQGLLKV